MYGFNEHFIAAGHLFKDNSAGPVSTTDTYKNTDSHTPQFTLHTFSLYEVATALQSINPRKSTGADNLDPFFLKLSSPFISEQITHIFNLSISSGVFPSIWKSAQVTPLYRSGDISDPSNYLPISKLSRLSKVLESLVNKQLKTFLSIHCILSPHQSGLRAKHSTTSATTLTINNIVSDVDKEGHCAAVFYMPKSLQEEL